MNLKGSLVHEAKGSLTDAPEVRGKVGQKPVFAAEEREKDLLDKRVAELQTLLDGMPVAAVTVIGEDAEITGNLKSNGPVELRGTLRGNITSAEDIKLYGCLIGDAAGINVCMSDCCVEGNVHANRHVSMNQKSMIIGNVYADSMMMNGKVKGDLIIKNTLVLDYGATLYGNASAANISIREGAVFHGEMKNTDADLDAVFESDRAW